ncbi:MAG: isopenicillin N synthase family oxygenase [Gammaproteobacteria bacterium]|nr:isopenicillin N synthase family oxygenase [Gammaproteobacteria bacterium]MBT6024581.1 isopenicillin N synthase family oxygenase [Gammaproteobacteria bacterium]MBT6557859.1 isopenicillin N synthase family oxygenase [Gammaproteobacteria bacterium]
MAHAENTAENKTENQSETKIDKRGDLHEIPTVNWLDLESNRNKFMQDLRYALSECGFLVLTNAPGLDEDFQQRAFKEVRGFFNAPMDIKKTAHISNTPYFRGYSLPTPADRGQGQVIENFQYGFEQQPVCAHDDTTQPIHKRLFRGPNTWPKSDSMPGFQPLIEDLNLTYHRLTHQLGELIVESLGEDPAQFSEYFDFDDPDLAASLNHNFSMDVFTQEAQEQVRTSYEQFDSKTVGAHIDGPPFVALLINDRPGLQVVAGEGRWMDAPVTCRTAPGDYSVPVIPGSVIVNTGGTLMHLSEGRYSATLHRVNTTLIPKGETRVSMPYFLLPKMEGDLIPFGKSTVSVEGAAGYKAGRDRGANACVNRMGTFPQVTRRWWVEEFKELSEQQREEVEAETAAAYSLAAQRGKRYKESASK